MLRDFSRQSIYIHLFYRGRWWFSVFRVRWFVGRFGVGWVFRVGWLVSRFVRRLVVGVFSLALVRDIGHVTVLVGLVVDGLQTSVGQLNVVAARLSVTVAAFLVPKVVVGVVVFNGVSEVVRNRSL